MEKNNLSITVSQLIEQLQSLNQPDAYVTIYSRTLWSINDVKNDVLDNLMVTTHPEGMVCLISERLNNFLSDILDESEVPTL